MAKEDGCSFSEWDGLQGGGSGGSEVPAGSNGNWKTFTSEHFVSGLAS